MTSGRDMTWERINEVKSDFNFPCLRFASGTQLPTLTWLVPSRDSIWTMNVSTYNPQDNQFSSKARLMFQYLRAKDVGVYIPGMPPSMQIAKALGKTILVGSRQIDFDKGGFFSTNVIKSEAEHPAEVDEMRDADYLLRSYGGSWEGIQEVSQSLYSQLPEASALGQTGVYEVFVYSGEHDLCLIGSTWDAKLWFSSSTDGGETWEIPSIIANHATHPVITGMQDGRLITIYIRADSQLEPRKNGDLITVSPTTGSLWVIEQDYSGQWGRPRELLSRSDILHCSVCNDDCGHFYVAFDVYPEQPVSIVWGQDALFSGKPFSQIYIICSSDNGQTWTEPVSVSTREQSYFNPEIAFCNNKLILGAICREPEGWSILTTSLPREGLLG